MNILGTEAGRGQLTGPLACMCLCGSLVLLPCAALSFTRHAAVAVLTLLAAPLCLPLFLYRVAPSLLTRLSHAPTSAFPDQVLVLDPMAAAGLAAIALLGFLHRLRLPVEIG